MMPPLPRSRRGIASVQCGYGNTAPLQLEFDPKFSISDCAVDIVLNLIESHFKEGGTININVLDGDKLMAANKDRVTPDLVVRVTGFARILQVFRRISSAGSG